MIIVRINSVGKSCVVVERVEYLQYRFIYFNIKLGLSTCISFNTRLINPMSLRLTKTCPVEGKPTLKLMPDGGSDLSIC